MSPDHAYVEGFCSAAYPYTPPERPSPDVQQAWDAGVRDASGGDQESVDLEYLRELGGPA